MTSGKFLPERIGAVLKHPFTSHVIAVRCLLHCWTTPRSSDLSNVLFTQAHPFRWRCLHEFLVPYCNLPDQMMIVL